MAWSTGSIYYGGATGDTTVYTYDKAEERTGWTDPAYRTITLAEPATGAFLAWLQKYAVKQ